MVVGLVRARNEESRIGRCVGSLFRVCDMVLVLDDASTDRTAIEAARAGARVIEGDRHRGAPVNESRDRQQLWDAAGEFGARWVVVLDADEELMDPHTLRREIEAATLPVSFVLRIVYLWDGEDRVRTDGIYGAFFRPSVAVWERASYRPGTRFAGLHCGSLPVLRCPRVRSRAWIKHYGYMTREERLRKFRYYREIDPDNPMEDGYRHVVIGDLPGLPATARTRHAGPLRVEPLPDVAARWGLVIEDAVGV